MQKILTWLDGKKTYVVAITTGILAGLTAYGLVIPAWVWLLLGAIGLGSVRDAIGKLQK